MRSQVVLRAAKDSDVEALLELWEDVVRRGDRETQLRDISGVLERSSAEPRERIMVAELDDRVVGAVHLSATTITPINLEPVVQMISPHVLPEYRRHGVGTVLVEAAVSFAEELGIGHIGTAVMAGARESNRFMARLGFGQAAALRLAPTATIKTRLHGGRARVGRVGHRQLTTVLAARRSMRRTSSHH